MPDTPTLLNAQGEPLVRAKADPLVAAPGSADPLSIAQYRARRAASGVLFEKQLQYSIYKRHTTVYSVVEMLVQACSLEALHYSKPEHAKVAALETFFAAVNPDQDLQALLAEIYRDVGITGEAFALKQRKGGQLIGLRRMLNAITYVVPDKDGHPDHIEQKLPRVSQPKKYALEDVLWFRLPDPEDECRGLSPLAVLDLVVSSDLQAQQTFQGIFANGMVGNKTFALPASNQTIIERNREYLKNVLTRPENAYTPTIFEGDVKLVDKGDTKGLDAPFQGGRKLAREEVVAVYSIPYSKLYPDEKGALGQAGKEADDVTFQRDTIAPLQRMAAGTLNRQLLLAEWGIADLELKSPSEELARLDRVDVAVSATSCGMTGNEIRTIILKLPASDAPGMDEPLFLIRGMKSLADAEAGPETLHRELSTEGTTNSAQQDPDTEPSPRKPLKAPPDAQPAQKAWPLRLFAREKARDKRTAALLAFAAVQGKADRSGAQLRRLMDRYTSGGISEGMFTRAARRVQTDNLRHATQQAQKLTGQAAATPDSDAAVERVVALGSAAQSGAISAKQAAARAEAEGGAAKAAFQAAKVSGYGDEPLTWQRSAGSDSCQDCLALDGETRPASEWDVQPGDCQCRDNCNCDLVPETASDREAA